MGEVEFVTGLKSFVGGGISKKGSFTEEDLAAGDPRGTNLASKIKDNVAERWRSEYKILPMAMWRSKSNKIARIVINDSWLEDPELIKQAARDHFAAAFKKTDQCCWSMENMKFDSLNDNQRQFLESKITEEEVCITLKDCDGSKAPGPDGFNMKFFKKYWRLIKGEVMGFLEEFHEKGRLSEGINKTFIVLIPKVANPQRFIDFRPISLVNSIYKILSKCLARRLSSVLPHLISANQSAFIANRSILDGIMVTNELIHALKIEKRAALIIKLDFRKAYDSVSWQYLRLIQRCMGFGNTWRKWMEECYSSVTMAVLINGSPSKEFTLERGLRQGDPLSPFLFLLAAEGFSRILNRASEAGFFEGVEWMKGGERLSHLQFADDTILFCKAELGEVQRLKRILKIFEGCSGLKINYSKSMCFGLGLKEEETQSFAKQLNCPVGRLPMNYLGIKVGGNPANKETWEPIVQRFNLKLASWRSANLSMAGRVILIKSALCSLPLYYASIYKIPISVAKKMEMIQRRFLWGGSEGGRKIHYVKWDSVKKPKKFGGLGIQGLIEKNLVLLAKWWWKLIEGEGGLWRRMIIEKYGLKQIQDPVNVKYKSSRISSTWRNIIKTVQGNTEIALAFREGIKFSLGNGSEVSFWEDSWSGPRSLKDQYPKLFSLAVVNKAKVSEMGQWVNGVWHWKVVFRRPLYDWEEVNRAELMEGLRHLQLKENENDRIVWTYSEDGLFSTNTLMKAALKIREKSRKWEQVPFKLWTGLAPPKVELLMWKIYLNSLPSKMTLHSRKILKREQDLACVLCGLAQESTDHLLIHCEWSWYLWSYILSWWGGVWVWPKSSKILLESWEVRGVSSTHKGLWKILCYATLWSIWEERNARCFRNKRSSVTSVGELVKARVAWWAKIRNTNCPYSVTTIKRCIVEVRDNS
ncbi:hypothetical protein QQ045_019477 [Rhodiola kirilowii]